MLLDVLAVVEIDEHRRILQDADQQIAEAAGRVRPEHLVLLEHHPVVADLVLTGREMAVPEERQLLLERTPARQHPVRPPQAETLGLDVVGGQAVEELVDDPLEPALGAGRQDFHAERLAVGPGEANRLGSTRRKRIHAGIPDARFVERRQAAVDRLVLDQRFDHLLRRHRRQPRDFLGWRAESGTLDEMRGAGGAPIGGGDRRQIAGPVGGTGRAIVRSRRVHRTGSRRYGQRRDEERGDGEAVEKVACVETP